MEKNIQTIRLRLQKRKNALLRTDHNRCGSDLSIFLKFLDEEPVLRNILESQQLIGYELDFETWRGEFREKGFNFPHDECERAAMCLAILKHYAVVGNPWSLIVGITREGNLITLTRKFMEYFARPLYEYLDEQVQMRQDMITSKDVMKETQALVDGRLGRVYPDVQRGLQQAYRDLFAADAPEACQNVARTCRQTLIAFANEVYQPEFLPDSEKQPKGDDATNKLKYTVRHAVDGSARDRYSRAWEDLIEANWKFVNAVTHLKSASQEDAKASVIYTYLTISQVGRLLESRD
jgi:hypothetical protein